MSSILDISNEQYHGMKECISFSGLKEFAKSPAHYKAYLDRKVEPTKAMKFGSGFHALIGEPELFSKTYVKSPEGLDRRTKEGKAQWEAFLAEHAGKEILSHDEYDKLDGMLNSILHNKTALNLLKDGRSEVSGFWTDPETGVLCKCRPDFLRSDNMLVDLKTTEDASSKGFERSLVNFRYDIQTAFYLRGMSIVLNEPLNAFVHVVAEKNSPYAIANYALDDYSIDYANNQINRLLIEFAECINKNNWPSYKDEIQNISTPDWVR